MTLEQLDEWVARTFRELQKDYAITEFFAEYSTRFGGKFTVSADDELRGYKFGYANNLPEALFSVKMQLTSRHGLSEKKRERAKKLLEEAMELETTSDFATAALKEE